MSAPKPKTGTCGKCEQARPLFPARKEWGDVPESMCSPCWQVFAEARANGTFVDWGDAFDNATDEQLNEHVSGYEVGP
ncbi:hypothetical protein [Actinomadura rubrisoli]|uniref:Uncharacterized protein n=1 Tax=Actinomadura rubrisoli TaxID=2530368 RepID=A0A4R5CJM6_9ACTN|nr:hypothetical protein [Actinomadura rubrisoli]TDD97594.1 hypothetical protein E1298_00765 [Actinomadura rubrisoli]